MPVNENDSHHGNGISSEVTVRAYGRWFHAFVALVAFLVYMTTMSSTLQVGDAGEQIAAAYCLGISHPNGNPLYLLTAKAWMLILPFGSIVFRLNLLNAVFGSIGVYVFARLLSSISTRIGFSRVFNTFISSSFALTLGFSLTYWHKSTEASSYMLNVVLTMIWLLILVRSIAENSGKHLSKLYFITGLALASHILSLILLIVTGCFAFSLFRRKHIGFKSFAFPVFAIIPGLSLYLYIPVRAGTEPVFNWGRPTSLETLLNYLLRAGYQNKAYVSSFGDFLVLVRSAMESSFSEIYPLVPFVLLFLGGVFFWPRFLKFEGEVKKNKIVILPFRAKGVQEDSFGVSALGWVIIFVGLLLFVLNLFFLCLHGSHTDLFFWPRYMFTGNVGLFLSCAVFSLLIMRGLCKPHICICLSCFVLLPFFGLIQNFEKNDRSENNLLDSFSKTMFSHLPEGATFYVMGDNFLFPSAYYCIGEGFRPDLDLHNPAVGFMSKKGIVGAIKTGSLYSSHHVTLKPPLKCLPHGLVYKITADGPSNDLVLEWQWMEPFNPSPTRFPLEKTLLVEYMRRRAVYHNFRGEKNDYRFWVNQMGEFAEGYDRTMMLTGWELVRSGYIQQGVVYLKEALRINPKNRLAKQLLDQYGFDYRKETQVQ